MHTTIYIDQNTDFSPTKIIYFDNQYILKVKDIITLRKIIYQNSCQHHKKNNFEIDKGIFSSSRSICKLQNSASVQKRNNI